MVHAEIDKSKFPIVNVKFFAKDFNQKAFENYLRELAELNSRQEPYTVIFDASESVYLSPEQRLKQGEWMKEHYELYKKNTIGAAYIIPSYMIRCVMNAVFSMKNKPANYTVVSSVEEAYKWAEEVTYERAYA
jgi:hypothetical protein